MKGVRRIGGKKRTTAAVFSSPNSMFTPGWDDQFGAGQKWGRVGERANMGQKKTPRGAGKLKKK